MTRRVLGLLHTAESHRVRFDRLLAELAPETVGWVHCVRDVLLRQALDTFPVNTIAAGIEAALATLQSQGATQVLCTCSSVGGMAEQVGRQMGLPTLRVDRGWRRGRSPPGDACWWRRACLRRSDRPPSC